MSRFLSVLPEKGLWVTDFIPFFSITKQHSCCCWPTSIAMLAILVAMLFFFHVSVCSMLIYRFPVTYLPVPTSPKCGCCGRLLACVECYNFLSFFIRVMLKRKCNMNVNIIEDPFIKGVDGNVECTLCNSKFCISHGRRSDIGKHVKTKKS
jgi:hypothetical protein